MKGTPILTVGSLFSGIGGLEYGLELTGGFTVKWQVEINDYATKVLAKHWPDVARYGDVRTVGIHNLEPVDLICGGFPCQPHSLAGQRGGSGDERDLWGEFSRLICELRPRWVLAENVPGLLSSEDGRFFRGILRDLTTAGYDAEWQTLPAAAFGAPHLRNRVFIVAYASCDAWKFQQSQWQDLRNQPAINGASGYLTNVADSTSQSNRIQTYRDCGQEWQPTDASQPAFLRQEYGQTCSKGVGAGSQNVADSTEQQLEIRQIFTKNAQQKLTSFARDCSTGTGQWAVEPDVDRVVDGVPSRVDRLRGLGNAVVPQCAQYIGQCILAHADAMKGTNNQ